MYKIILSKDFKEDIKNILSFYKKIDDKFFKQFYYELENIRDSIIRNPNIYVVRYGCNRRVNFKKYPFCIFFKSDANSITMLRVMHQSMDPTNWP